MLYEIKRAWKDERGVIHHETESFPYPTYKDIRGGLSWPQKGFPGFYVVAGRRDYRNVRDKYPIMFLAEAETDNVQVLFRRLTDDSKKLMCEPIYANLALEWAGYEHSFGNYLGDNDIQGVSLQQAPYVENLEYGLSLIRTYLDEGALGGIENVPILRQQLGRIPRVLDGDAAIEFYAAAAACHLIGGYEKFSGGTMTPEQAKRLYEMYGPPRSQSA